MTHLQITPDRVVNVGDIRYVFRWMYPNGDRDIQIIYKSSGDNIFRDDDGALLKQIRAILGESIVEDRAA